MHVSHLGRTTNRAKAGPADEKQPFRETVDVAYRAQSYNSEGHGSIPGSESPIALCFIRQVRETLHKGSEVIADNQAKFGCRR